MSARPTRSWLLGAAVIVAATALAVEAATGAGRADALRRVTMFGDSQLAGVALTADARAMLGKGIDLDLRAQVCRRLVQVSCPYQGVRPPTVLDEVRESAQPLGSTAVFLVGYNDYEDEWARDIDAVMRALVARDVTGVLWLTLTERRPDWTRMNAILRRAPSRWPQLEVLDWSDAADPSWFAGDDIHLTPEGARGLASYVHAALVVRGVAAQTPVAPPRVPLRVTVRGVGAVLVKGVRCRRACTQAVAVGTVVRLRASAPAGSTFARWGGACAGTKVVCVVRVQRATTVLARFRPA